VRSDPPVSHPTAIAVNDAGVTPLFSSGKAENEPEIRQPRQFFLHIPSRAPTSSDERLIETTPDWIRVDNVGCSDKLRLRAFDVDTVVKRDAQSGFAQIRSRRHLLPI